MNMYSYLRIGMNTHMHVDFVFMQKYKHIWKRGISACQRTEKVTEGLNLRDVIYEHLVKNS